MRKFIKIISLIVILAAILALFVFFAMKETKVFHRDLSVLMNRYYLLKQSNPESAQNALRVILRQDQNYQPALNELSQLYIKQNNDQAALPLLKRLHELSPDDPNAMLNLANLYYKIGDWKKASLLYAQLKEEKSPMVKADALNMLNKMASSIPNYKINADLDVSQMNQEHAISHSVTIWLDYFYKIKMDKPQQAKELLGLLALIAPENALIQEELGFAALKSGNEHEATSNFLQAYDLQPSARTALQLAYLYMNQKDNEKAAQFFLLASHSEDPAIQKTALQGYELVRLKEPHANIASLDANKVTASADQLLLDQFYALKKTDKNAAWKLIQHIISRYPNNAVTLKEGGFLAIDTGHREEAIAYLTQAYRLTYEPDVAMQLGYLYDFNTGGYMDYQKKYIAYQYFKHATTSTNAELALRAQNALTNLAGLQTKALPDPFFGELFFDPFTQNRFGLTVRPIVGRLGVQGKNRFQSKVYAVFRQSDDNKSLTIGQVPQIYEDNVRIIGGGVQITPSKRVPLVAFVEAGRAYDLIYRNRNRWRGDLRAGVMYYNEFGTKPAYFDRLKISSDYYSTLYGDATYFSRYDNNVIGTIKTHQGIRLLQYRSSMINLYVTGRIIEDTRREFFNNIAEIGPGIGWTPSNRYRVQLRFEHINGAYLPAGRSVNPYGKYYTNNIVQLFVYLKI